jgi:hypothetical protein
VPENHTLMLIYVNCVPEDPTLMLIYGNCVPEDPTLMLIYVNCARRSHFNVNLCKLCVWHTVYID